MQNEELYTGLFVEEQEDIRGVFTGTVVCNQAPVWYSSYLGHLSQFQHIRNHNMWLVDHAGRTVLHWCAIWGLPVHTEIAAIVQGTAQIHDLQDHNGQTVMHLCAMFGNEGLLNKMLRNEADKSIKDNCGMTAAQVASGH